MVIFIKQKSGTDWMKKRVYVDTSVFGGIFDEEFKNATPAGQLLSHGRVAANP